MLAYPAFAKGWERFSYYGMSALLILYMTQQLLLPGTIKNVAGIGTVRTLLERVSGPLSPVASASQIVGIYGAVIYATPLLSAWIAQAGWVPRAL